MNTHIINSMSDDDFWESENAIVRARVLQNPALMAGAIEVLQQQMNIKDGEIAVLQAEVKELLEWKANTLNRLSSMSRQLRTTRP